MATQRRIARWLCGCLALGLVAPAAAQDLDTVEESVLGAEGVVGQLATRYLQPAAIARQYSFSGRLAEGQVRYILAEYDSAAMILVELVENPQFVDQEGYSDALWMLADSLFENRNFVLARAYFEQLVARRDARYGLDSARRLLEVAFALRDYDGLDDLYAAMQAQWSGQMGPEIAYVRGKALYFQGRYDDAYGSFAAIPGDSDLYDRARYFMGVIRARGSVWAEAQAEFDGVRARIGEAEAPDAATQDVAALATLALGRVYYEQGMWQEAVDAYSTISRISNRYDDALYEQAWANIRRENYAAAFDELEILSIVAEDGRLVPEAELLQGDLLMRMRRFDEAVVAFGDVEERYAPIETELRELARSERSPEEYFDSMVDPENGALRIPTLARPWFQQDATVEGTLALVQDVSVLRADVEMGRAVVAELQSVLDGVSAVDMFPEWREGWGQAIESERALTSANAALVNLERELVWPAVQGDARARYESLREQRLAIEREYAQVPRTFAELDERTERTLDDLNGVSVDAYVGEQQATTILEEVEALRSIIGWRLRDGEIDAGLAAAWNAELDTIAADAQRSIDRSGAVRDDVRARQVRVGVADDVSRGETELQDRYIEALRTEQQFLAGYRTASGESPAVFERIDELWRRSVATTSQVETFFAAMDRLVREETAALRSAVAEEDASLRAYEELLAHVEADSAELAGEVAQDAFIGIHRRFRDLTMRAYLGVIDVSWEEKETLTNRIEELFEQRNEALRILDADFSELLEEP